MSGSVQLRTARVEEPFRSLERKKEPHQLPIIASRWIVAEEEKLCEKL